MLLFLPSLFTGYTPPLSDVSTKQMPARLIHRTLILVHIANHRLKITVLVSC